MLEIERKFSVKEIPCLEDYSWKILEQAYISFSPCIRVRHYMQESEESFELTVKGKGFLSREELNLPITEDEYSSLKEKTQGLVIRKKRYYIPYMAYTIELDIFEKEYEGLCIAEVEFSSVEEAESFVKPDWFFDELTGNKDYTNSGLASGSFK